jgi:hypothetical protein
MRELLGHIVPVQRHNLIAGVEVEPGGECRERRRDLCHMLARRTAGTIH